MNFCLFVCCASGFLLVLLGDHEALEVSGVDHAVLDLELGECVITFLKIRI